MSFKVFCAEKEGKNGTTYYQGWTGRAFGKITVFEGSRKSDGTRLLIVNIARPFKRRRFKSNFQFKRSNSSNRKNYSR